MRAGIVISLMTLECANDDVVSKIAMPACLLSKYGNRQLEFLPGPQYNQARSPIAPTLTWNRALFPKSAKALDDARRAKEEQGRKFADAVAEASLLTELAEIY